MKLFVEEEGSGAMRQFAATESDRNKVVSALARVEASSAVCRLRKSLRLTPSEAAVMLDAIVDEVRNVTEQPVTPRILDAASRIVNRHSIRTLDAIQLGSAIVVRETFMRADVRFIASDRELLNAANSEGFPTWDPMEGSAEPQGWA